MRRQLLLASLCLAVAIATTSPALAAYAPKIYAKSLGASGVNLRVGGSPADDPTARVQLLVPAGYTGNFAAAPGTTLGPASAHVQVADLASAIASLAGSVLVANPVDPAIVDASSRCDPVPHAAIWVLSLTAAGQTLPIPVFVDQVSGPLAALASYTLTICLPPPDVPPGTPGRAPLGAKLIDADVTIDAIVAPSTRGRHLFVSIWTPYSPGIGQANAAGTVIAESLWFQPTTLSITTRVSKGKTSSPVVVSGTLAAAGQGAPAQKIDIFAGRSTSALKKIGSATTNGAGAYTFKTRIKVTTSFRARAASPDRELGTSLCTPLPGVPAPCISATVAGGTLTSSTVKAVRRK